VTNTAAKPATRQPSGRTATSTTSSTVATPNNPCRIATDSVLTPLDQPNAAKTNG
jgi:hypothetical protein